MRVALTPHAVTFGMAAPPQPLKLPPTKSITVEGLYAGDRQAAADGFKDWLDTYPLPNHFAVQADLSDHTTSIRREAGESPAATDDDSFAQVTTEANTYRLTVSYPTTGDGLKDRAEGIVSAAERQLNLSA